MRILIPNDSTDQKERQHHPSSLLISTVVKHSDSLKGSEELRPLVYQTPNTKLGPVPRLRLKVECTIEEGK